MVDVLDTVRIHCVVKGENIRQAMSNFLVRSRGLLFTFVGTSCVGHDQFKVTISIPTETLPAARAILNEWMSEDVNIPVGTPYPNGSLLTYAPSAISTSDMVRVTANVT